MPRGEGERAKVHYKGESDDFVVFVESIDAVKAWKEDPSKPIIDVVDSFNIFVTHKHGAQGVSDRASKLSLETEFGTSNEDEVVKKILQKGEVQESKSTGRQGSTNDNNATGNN